MAQTNAGTKVFPIPNGADASIVNRDAKSKVSVAGVDESMKSPEVATSQQNPPNAEAQENPDSDHTRVIKTLVVKHGSKPLDGSEPA